MRIVVLIVVVGMLLACGRVQDEPIEPTAAVSAPKAEEASESFVPDPKPDTVPTPTAEIQVTPTPLPVVANGTSEKSVGASASAHIKPYEGETTLEERIASADVIAIVRMAAVTTGVEEYVLYTHTAEPTEREEFVGVLKFTFKVRTYLKNDGTSSPKELTAIVKPRHWALTRAEAQTIADQMLADRDTQWDDRDAVIFLVRQHSRLPVTNSDNVFYMSVTDIFNFIHGDEYSIASKRNKLWLPEAKQLPGGPARTPSEKWFLTDVPTGATEQSGQPRSSNTPSHEPPSMAQSALVQEINRVTAEMNAEPQDGFAMCIAYGYLMDREDAWGTSHDYPRRKPAYFLQRETGSGLPAGTSFRNIDVLVVNENWKDRIWFEGDDADMFVIGDVVRTWENLTYNFRNSFNATGGKFLVTATLNRHSMEATRPLPKGGYTYVQNSYSIFSGPCEHYKEVINWTVHVTAPEGTLHELFFDPVTDGTAIAADSTIGQLKPAAFTDANDAPATILRISYDSGYVTTTLFPHTGLAGHKLDFIALDGSVSLSLQVDDATVDAANKTLSWQVSEQPWHDGDKLMVRISFD